MRRPVIAICLALLLFGTACSNDDDPGTDDPTPETTLEATSEPSATPCSLEGASKDKVEVPVPDDSTAPISLLSDVRPNAVACPRVVFEFENRVPYYTIEYVDPPVTDCGEGAEMPVDDWGAEGLLFVKLVPAASADFSDELRMTYDGPNDIDIDGAVLKHMRKTCDYEADNSWLIGLDTPHPFKVSTFDDPARLVIDISEAT